MTLTRTNFRLKHGYIVSHLLALGVPARMLQSRKRRDAKFWLRQINHLAVLEYARDRWRQLIARWHPDRPGGCATLAQQINRCWQYVERMFRKHGYQLG